MHMKVLHLITGLIQGGAETQLMRLLSAMDTKRFESRVVSMIPVGVMGEPIRALGVPVDSLGMQAGTPSLKAFVRLCRVLRSYRPDVVQTWLYHADLIGLAASATARQGRVIWNVRCSDMDIGQYGPSTRWTIKLLRSLSRLPAAVVANSEAGRRFHQSLGYKNKRFEVIQNGFDTDQFRPNDDARTWLRNELGLASDAVLVGHAGRFDPMKDHESLLAAAAVVVEDNPKVAFVLCGPGVEPHNSDVASLVAKYGLARKAHLLGRRSDMNRIMAGMDLYVSSSAFGEGFPNVLAEALACGVPCVATDVGDSAILVGESGRVVPPRDPRAFSKAVIEMLGIEGTEKVLMKREARERIIRYYSLEAMARRYESLYNQIAG